MENTSEKNKITIKSTLEKIKYLFFENKKAQLIAMLFVGILSIGLVFYYINSNYYLTQNPYIIDSGWFSSKEKTAEIILHIGETNAENGNYEEALFGSDSIYDLPEEIKGNSIKFPGLNAFTEDKYLKNSPSVKEANYWIGICYYNLAEKTDSVSEKYDKYALAMAHIEKATESEIFSSFKLNIIGDIYAQLNKPELALEFYQKSIDNKNHLDFNYQIIDKAAEQAKILGKNDLAKEYYQEMLEFSYQIENYKDSNREFIIKKIAEIEESKKYEN